MARSWNICFIQKCCGSFCIPVHHMLLLNLVQLFVEKCCCFLRKALESAIFQQCISVLHYSPQTENTHKERQVILKKVMISDSLFSTLFCALCYLFSITLTPSCPIW